MKTARRLKPQKSFLSGLLALLLIIGPLAVPITNATTQPLVIPAPKWHAGEWWRVRMALMTGGMATDDRRPSPPLHDSTTDFIVYHFTVLAQRTLKYEEEDGQRHVGQRVPPERCWAVKVTLEPGPYVSPKNYNILYFRVKDLSVREVVQSGPTSSDFAFIYTGTVLNDDNPKHSIATYSRGPYFAGETASPLLAWAVFPIKAGKTGNETVTADDNGLDVVLDQGVAGEREIRQTWLPGEPWWSSSNSGGLLESRLIETSH